MIDAALNFFYPPICQICRERRSSAAEGYVCAECWGGVRFITPPFCNQCGLPFDGKISAVEFRCENCREVDWAFATARSAVHANQFILEVIHRYKYSGALWFEPFLGDLLMRQAVVALQQETWDFIVPVPLHATKEREREFNQASRLARRLSAATGIPTNTKLARRVKATTTQTTLTRPERAANMSEAFECINNIEVRGKRIVLLDDVLTTGATTNACATALRQAGAGKMCVWTLARGT